MQSEHTAANAGQHVTTAPVGAQVAEGDNNNKSFGYSGLEQSHDAHHPQSEDADDSELLSTDDFGSDGAHPPQQHPPSNGSSVPTSQTAAAANPNGTISTAAPVPVQLPCLIGKFHMEGSTAVCTGQWGMSKADHGRADMTSPFEFRLSQATDPSRTEIPISGKYAGWFMVKQPAPKNALKVEEKDLELTFTPNASGNYTVNGTGVNRFGKFTMNGTATSSGDMELFRAYEIKKAAQPKSTKRVKRQELPASPTPPPRRQSRGTWKDKAGVYEDFEYDGPVETQKPKRPAPQPAETAAERPKRLSEHLKRCGEILKILWKHPSAVWFREPVDPAKLGILDYHDIIKDPMDFGTIQYNLDNFEYDTPERFAEHVRLVFRNAITYNQLRTNPVHVAARELSDQFEEKYRIMISQLGSAGITSSQPRTANKRQRVKSRSRSQAPGPRSYEPIGGYDPNAPYLAEMQRQMQEMQKTIQRLQTEIKHKEARPAPVSAAAAEPLTMEEKRHLISQINNLPPEKLTRVVQIVQDALPSRPGDDDDDEVEIPLDNLDTQTLRKLQNYVDSCMRATQKRKRPVAQRQSAAQLYTVAQDKKIRDDVSISSSHEQMTFADSTHQPVFDQPASTAPELASAGFFSGSLGAQELAAGSGTDESENEQHDYHNGADFGAGNKVMNFPL